MARPKRRIAICAPATPISRALAKAVTALAAREFPEVELAFHEQCFVEEGHFAGSDAVRLAALLDCANDPGADALWLAKGGYGTNRIAAEAVARMGPAAREKCFLGYSDGGYLLAALYRAGVGRPVHGPMPVDIGRERGAAAVRRALAFLSEAGGGAVEAAGSSGGDGIGTADPQVGGRPGAAESAGAESGSTALMSDAAREGLEPSLDGRTPGVAFNLMTLAMLAGTELMPDLIGHVVMVEEVGEYLYAVDRLFFHLMPQLRGIAGLRLGRISKVPANDRPFGATAEEIARHWCARGGIPFLGSADIGHDVDNRIVPFGLAAGAAGP